MEAVQHHEAALRNQLQFRILASGRCEDDSCCSMRAAKAKQGGLHKRLQLSQDHLDMAETSRCLQRF
jgi:hypothetical protein